MDHYSLALARGDTSQRPTSLQLPVTIPETLQPSRGHSLGHHCFSGKRLSNMVPSLCARSYIPGSGSCQHASLGLDVLRWCCPYFTSFITIHAVLIAIRPSEFLNAMAWPSYNTTIWAYESIHTLGPLPCPEAALSLQTAACVFLHRHQEASAVDLRPKVVLASSCEIDLKCRSVLHSTFVGDGGTHCIFADILHTNRADKKAYCVSHNKLCPLMPAKEHDRLLALLMFGVENMQNLWLAWMATQVSYVELMFQYSVFHLPRTCCECFWTQPQLKNRCYQLQRIHYATSPQHCTCWNQGCNRLRL